MNIRLLLVIVPLLAGCLSTAPKEPTNWMIEYSRADARVKRAPLGESVRISNVDVCAPYSGRRLVVLRSDGTIAFDAYNTFASSPALLLGNTAFRAVEVSGVFGSVITPDSSAKAQYEMEIVVTQLALDCRTAGKRTARAAVLVLLLQGREIVACVRGEGAEEAGDDFSAAFSTAFVRTLNDALGKLPVR